MFKNIPDMFFNTVKKYENKEALNYIEDGEYISIDYKKFGKKVENLAYGLSLLNIKKGDKVAILGNNSPEWIISDFAIQTIGSATVPIYPTLTAEQIEYILKDSESKAVFVDSLDQFYKVEKIFKNLDKLKNVILFYDSASADYAKSFKEVSRDGENGVKDGWLEKTIYDIDKSDLCSIVYTSGTTGDPKGVMLTHFGAISNVVSSEKVVNIYSKDRFFSFLPLSHLYERLAGHWVPIYKGASIYYAQSLLTVMDDISKAKPSVMVSVPRLFEKIEQKVLQEGNKGSVVKKSIFNWAMSVGMRYVEQKKTGRIEKLTELKYKAADKLVFSKIRGKLGGELRTPIAGGAPISIGTLQFFDAIGLSITEGYGMTETHLIITLTPPGSYVYGSCGKPLDCLKLRIDSDGEVLISGDTLMKGYFNKPDLTKETIDSEGWLHTGDIGYLDRNGYLFLTDRKKNILITSGGKNIAPAPIENEIKKSLYIEDLCLIGNKRKFISAIVIPSFENIEVWCKDKGVDYKDHSDMVKQDKVYKLLESEIEKLQKNFSRVEKVKKFILLDKPLTIEDGELTPSLKIKRDVVESRYKEEIDQLYQ